MTEGGGRVLALDVGERRIGVAVSDEMSYLARSVATIKRRSVAQALDALDTLIQEWRPVAVIVGLPRHMDGSLGPQAERVMAFARLLQERIAVPIVYWDERLSSISAEDILRRQGVTSRDQKLRIDAVAAAVILQEYLDAQRQERPDYGLLPPDAPSEAEPRRRGGREKRARRRHEEQDR